MKKIVLLSIFNLLAITGFVLLMSKQFNVAYNIENVILLVLSTMGILTCGVLLTIIAEEFKFYKAKKFLEGYKKDDKD